MAMSTFTLEEMFLTQIPTWVIILIGIAVISTRQSRLIKDIDDLKKSIRLLRNQCTQRLKWCIDHFNFKEKGGDMK